MDNPTLEKLKERAACGAKELPETIYEAITFPHSSGWDEGCWQCAMRLESAIAGHNLGLSQGQWIPVEERLPEVGKEVLAGAFIECNWPDGRKTRGWQVALQIWTGERWVDSDDGEEDGATYWQPLPEPPKAVKNGD